MMMGIFVGCGNLHDNASVVGLSERERLPADNGDSVYYWYDGEKQYLLKDYSATFIVCDTATDVTAGRGVISRGDYGDARNADGEMVSRTQGKKWAIVKGYLKRTRDGKDNPDIYYVSPVYKSPATGKMVKLSNLIHLKLKPRTNTKALYEQMEKYGLTLYSQNRFMSQWYSLFCETDAYGTALDVCDRLYETGLFAAVEPDFLGAFTVD